MIEALAYYKRGVSGCSLEAMGEAKIELGFLISVRTVSP